MSKTNFFEKDSIDVKKVLLAKATYSNHVVELLYTKPESFLPRLLGTGKSLAVASTPSTTETSSSEAFHRFR